MLQTVAHTIATHGMLENCCNLIVGISGGADSVCLLSVLSAYIEKNKLSIQLIAAHVNHGLRGADADADEAQVVALCEKCGIPLQIKHCDVAKLAKEQGVSVEMAGRTVRYDFFQQIADTLPHCKIAVAHHRDDRAETIFWNVIRGTGLEGLKGISYVRDNVIRPLLDVSKEEIRAYCKEQNLPVCEDASNGDVIYSRNKIRLELIPYMNKAFQTDMTEKILRLSDNVSADAAFLQEQAELAWQNCVRADQTIDVKKLLEQHEAIQIRILQRICQNQLEQVHLHGLLELIKQETTGKQLSLPGGIKAVIEYGTLRFQKEEPKPPQVHVFCEVVPVTEEAISKTSNQAMEQFFDYDLLLEQCGGNPERISVRTRQEGDYIRPLKGNGRKTLKKFFIDRKIPKAIRDSVPLVVLEHEVLWVVGYCRCQGYLPTKETTRCLKVCTKYEF